MCPPDGVLYSVKRPSGSGARQHVIPPQYSCRQVATFRTEPVLRVQVCHADRHGVESRQILEDHALVLQLYLHSIYRTQDVEFLSDIVHLAWPVADSVDDVMVLWLLPRFRDLLVLAEFTWKT